ncbi:MAG: hypothetical protein SLAVMIC_00425 [uncultured marine phage]|uniref:Uncharacterized protein n=1 Tax=uncultured marine phage TaxID=707152 RepID=A0A8D9CA04_9VIRU|nr:MAG: hypothetical protein SLAVMIC_00425 [uncultured marine phage]
MDLFKQAKQGQPEKPVKTDNGKVRVKPESIEQDELFEMLEEMAEIQKRKKALEAKFGMIADEVKQAGKEEFSKLFEDKGVNPGSFMLEAENEDGKIAQVMFIAQDKYIKINATQSEELKTEFGEDIVTEDTQYGFSKPMLEKYGQEISEAIMNSDIPDKDKGKIITASTAYSVAKGTINKLNDYGNVEVLVEKVKPVVMLKGAEVIG